jgi:hypothetical protein
MPENEELRIKSQPYHVVQRIEEQDAALVWVLVKPDKSPEIRLADRLAADRHGYQAAEGD